MMVAEILRRKRKITITTSAMVSMSVNFTSFTELRMETERSYKMFSLIPAGICCCICGSKPLDAVHDFNGVGPGLPLDGQHNARDRR